MYKIFYNIFFAIIGIIALLLIVSIFPITGNYKIYVVQSGSMEPAIRTGSVVVVKPANDYRVGDVITFGSASNKKAPTTHRILEIKNDNGKLSYITKGDANNAPDSSVVKYSTIIGKIIIKVPFVGYGVATAKTPWGFALVIGLPAVIIVGDELRKIFLEFRKMRGKKKSREDDDGIINLKK